VREDLERIKESKVLLQVKIKEAVDHAIYFVEGIGQSRPGMPLKLQTRLSTKYIPSQQ
jgi:hypothetical protein